MSITTGTETFRPLMVFTNFDLFTDQVQRRDHLFVVASAPQPMDNGYKITIQSQQPAAVLGRYANQYHQPYTVEQLRSESRGDLWLLSGGILAFDHHQRLAIGLRDGNGPDPFTFTNIGAGRCDGKLTAHCWRELTEELILCVREEEHWFQVRFFPHHSPPSLHAIRKKHHAIALWKKEVDPAATLRPLETTRVTIRAAQQNPTLLVEWVDSRHNPVFVEQLSGKIFLDQQYNTVEFRFNRIIDLSMYRPGDTAIFFAEGTGCAQWSTLEEVGRLAAAGMATPMLKHLTAPLGDR